MTVIEATKRNTTNTMEMFLRNFSHIPDDKLTWTSSPTAKSPSASPPTPPSMPPDSQK
jgi:hypothetical protein